MAAANTEPLVRPIRSAQTATMDAYMNPSYPMPRAALAIRNAMRPNAPRPDGVRTDGADPMVNYADGGEGFVPPGTMAPPQGGQPGGMGTMDAGPGADWSAQFQSWGTPNNGAGPTTQTAAGGVIQPEAPPDLTTPEGWQAFRASHMRQGVPTGAVAPRAAPMMRGQRLGSSLTMGRGPRTNY